MSQPIIFDKLGTVIVEGCYIAYGHALGRCAGIRIGKVLGVKVGEEITMWSNTPRQIFSITVQGVDDDWDHPIALTKRKGTLHYPDRVIVLPSIPETYRQLLG
jgi:hypothetical protein